MRVTEDLEVIVDGMADHHLPVDQLQYLLPGLWVRCGVDEITASDAAPSSTVVGDRHGGLDELIIDHISFVGHYTTARKLADAPFWSHSHHLTVNSEVLSGNSC